MRPEPLSSPQGCRPYPGVRIPARLALEPRKTAEKWPSAGRRPGPGLPGLGPALRRVGGAIFAAHDSACTSAHEHPRDVRPCARIVAARDLSPASCSSALEPESRAAAPGSSRREVSCRCKVADHDGRHCEVSPDPPSVSRRAPDDAHLILWLLDRATKRHLMSATRALLRTTR